MAGVALTSAKVLGDWIIVVLAEDSGSAPKSKVLAMIENRYGDLLSPEDWRTQPSNREVKWQNNTAWQRNRLVRDGVLEPVSRAGFNNWKLTPRGYARYQQILRKHR